MRNVITVIQEEARAEGRAEAEAGMRNVITVIQEEARAEGRAEAEAGMINVITEIKEEGRAEGRAEARAEALAQTSRATVATICSLLERGVLTREAVRTELQDLMDAGAITREIGLEALSQLS